VILTKSFGVLLFTGILLVCALAAGAKTFRQGFLLAFGLMVWIGIYHFGKSTTPDQSDQTLVNCLSLFDAEYIV
jgi:hypothetical protein